MASPWNLGLTKFGFLIDFDLLKAVTSTNTKPEVVLSCHVHHLEKLILRHISAAGAPFEWNLAAWCKTACQLRWYNRNRNWKYNSNMVDACFSKTEVVISQPRIELSIKLGLLIDFNLPSTVASTSRKPEVVLSGQGRHLEKLTRRQVSAVYHPIWMKFGSLMQNIMPVVGCNRNRNRK